MINIILNSLQKIGSTSILGMSFFGKGINFIAFSIVSFFVAPTYYRNMWKQFIEIAFFSIPVVALTSLFTGLVLALQSYIGFARFSAESAIANVVVISIVRELGPVMTALMVAGRISGAMAAEIGTMKVSEQIDAIYSMGVDPIKYLITPRIISGIIALPLLVVIADIVGVMGGFLISITQLDFSSTVYLKNTWNFVTWWDIVSGLIKASVFGLVITSMGCFFGYFSTQGAKGVGKATTNAVVVASILIFVFDYILTSLFFQTS